MAEASNTIREGFLCPMCHKDLRSPNNLIAHFQDLHSEEQDILRSIKDFYSKAKKKILNLDEQDLAKFEKDFTLTTGHYSAVRTPQEPGVSRSHSEYFKQVRRDRFDHTTSETNKLIIRLDRLLKCSGPDRKQQEQRLVTWLDGTTVTRCPSCAASFNLTRRQHHCRLCGSIMCNSCSYFLPYETAQTMVASVHSMEVNNSEASKETDSIRICQHCFMRLESRKRVQIEQMIQPVICQLYSHLQTMKKEIQECVDIYVKMYNSLTSGENTYQLEEVQGLRGNIAHKAELVDVLSKKIAALPIDEETPKAAALQANIRRSMSNYIKDNLLNLPPPPSPQEVEHYKRSRSLQRLEEEKQGFKAPPQIRKLTVTTGWSPQTFSTEQRDSSGDPILEQIKIVENYIKQAKQAQRKDEAAMLAENLQMLKETYRQSQLHSHS